MIDQFEVELGLKELMDRATGNLGLVWRELTAFFAIFVIWILIEVGSPFGMLDWPILIGVIYFIYRTILRRRGLLEDSDVRVFAFIGMAILLGLAIGIGVSFFIIPGLFLMVKWMVAPAVIVSRNRTIFDAAGDSWRATNGYFQLIMLALAILVVGPSILIILVEALANKAVGSTENSVSAVLDALSIPLMMVMMMGLSTALLELIGHRTSSKREAEKLAEAFD